MATKKRKLSDFIKATEKALERNHDPRSRDKLRLKLKTFQMAVLLKRQSRSAA